MVDCAAVDGRVKPNRPAATALISRCSQDAPNLSPHQRWW